MTRNAKKKAAPSGKSATSNANSPKHTPCACLGQGITRRDLWEAVAFLWLTSITPRTPWSQMLRESVWLGRDLMGHVDRARGNGAPQ